MTRFLTTVWPVHGHLHPNLAVANALRARGHEVAFYTGEKVRRLIEGEGLPLYPFRHLDEKRVDALLEAIGAVALDWRKLPSQRGLWREWLVETVPSQIADLDIVLNDWQPDVIICDPAMWAPFLILAESRRIPVAILNYLAGCILPGQDAPMLGFSVPRARTRFGRLWRDVLGRLMLAAATELPRAASALRQRYGLPPLDVGVTEYAARMPLYLQQSTPEFDYNRHDLPPSVHYVGPLPWDRPSNEPPPAFLSELPRDRPWVYVTDGTMHFQEPLVLRAALKGLADAPIQIVATTDKNAQQLGVGKIPANVHVERYVPHSDLLPRVDVVITTGGTGTVLKALKVGVPLIMVPSAWDQPENAWRVVEAGVGLRIGPRECTPERVRSAVEQILSDPTFRQNAEKFSRIFARYGGADRAAELLEGLGTHATTAQQSTA